MPATEHIRPELSEREQLYLNLGSTITRWQDVEMGVFDVFHKVSGMRRHVAQAVFFELISFESRFSITIAAASVALTDDTLKTWNGLQDRVGANQTIRNRLVHFSLALDPNRNPKARFQLSLEPNSLNPMRAIKSPDKKPPKYDLSQINTFGETFALLGGELTSFAEGLPGI